MLTISVALATYNGASFLREQLDSLAAQTYLPIELVVTDDQSSDNTTDIVREFAKIAPFPVILYINDCNIGYKENFLKCISLCRGEYIALCDQDDVWMNEKLLKLVHAISSSTMMIFHNADVIKDCNIIGRLYNIDSNVDYLPVGPSFFTFAPWGVTIMFNSYLSQFLNLHSISRNPDLENTTESHDQWLHFLARLFGEVKYLPESLVKYRQHQNNAVGWGRGRPIRNLIRNISYAGLRQNSLLACIKSRLSTIDLVEKHVSPEGIILQKRLKELEWQIDCRRQVYAGVTKSIRLKCLIKLFKLGLYSSDSSLSSSSFGSKGLIKDVIFGILLNRLLK